MARSSTKRAGGIVGVALVLASGAAVSTTSFASAPRGTTVQCKPDKRACDTGPVQGPKGSRANVAVADNDTAVATLTAEYVGPTFNCTDRGYTATSEQFVFDIQDFKAPAPDSLVKSVTFTAPLRQGAARPADYQVCFAAPYDFPAVDLRPSQSARDARSADFSGNTVAIPDIGTGEPGFRGILPLCSAGLTPKTSAGELHAPCLDSRSIDKAARTVTVVIVVPAADPAMRF